MAHDSVGIETTWWLMWSMLPEKLNWARLTIASDGSAEVLDCDGKYHRFATRDDARNWLNEDEFSRLDRLIEDGEVEIGTMPPSAASDAELIPKLLIHRPAQR
jgi:hypothetical protein